MSSTVNSFGQPIGPALSGWRERERPARAPLDGRYCRLEPVEVERHAADLFSAYMHAPDGRDWTYLFAERPRDLESFRAYAANLAASSDPLHYAIVDSVTRRAVGSAALMRVDPAHGAIEVGHIAYSPLLQNTRAGTEAMYLLMHYVFAELHYRRYEWKCDSLNAPSRKAALRFGFVFEGIFRQAVVYKGRSRDTAWYAVTDEDWPRACKAFELWLAPQNFDAAGRQRRALAEIRDPP